MSAPQTPNPDNTRPLEEIAGDAMQAVLTYALRAAKEQVGAETTLDLLEEIENGRARLDATLEIDGAFTRIRCLAVPKNKSAPTFVVAAIDLFPPPANLQ